MLEQGTGQMGKQSVRKHATRMEQGLDGMGEEGKPHTFWIVSGCHPNHCHAWFLFWVVSQRYEMKFIQLVWNCYI